MLRTARLPLTAGLVPLRTGTKEFDAYFPISQGDDITGYDNVDRLNLCVVNLNSGVCSDMR